MNAPQFLSIASVEALHRYYIGRFGGTLGLRDRAALESAVIHPQNVYYYGDGDLFDIAAAYAFDIAEAQCFLDGNKRAAVASALTFLEVNEVSGSFDEMELYRLMIRIAEKTASKVDLARYLRANCSRAR